jgi:hypothetical protein
MANPVVFLDYTFLIDTDKAFNHLFEFEKLFGEFLASRGLEATNIKSVEGSLAKRVMFITKKEQIDGMPEVKPVGRPETLKGQIKRLSDRKFRAPAIKFMKGK